MDPIPRTDITDGERRRQEEQRAIAEERRVLFRTKRKNRRHLDIQRAEEQERNWPRRLPRGQSRNQNELPTGRGNASDVIMETAPAADYVGTEEYGPFKWREGELDVTWRQYQANARIFGDTAFQRQLPARWRGPLPSRSELARKENRPLQRLIAVAWEQHRQDHGPPLRLAAPSEDAPHACAFTPHRSDWLPFLSLWPSKEKPEYMVWSNRQYTPPIPPKGGEKKVHLDERFGMKERHFLPQWEEEDEGRRYLAFIPMKEPKSIRQQTAFSLSAAWYFMTHQDPIDDVAWYVIDWAHFIEHAQRLVRLGPELQQSAHRAVEDVKAVWQEEYEAQQMSDSGKVFFDRNAPHRALEELRAGLAYLEGYCGERHEVRGALVGFQRAILEIRGFAAYSRALRTNGHPDFTEHPSSCDNDVVQSKFGRRDSRGVFVDDRQLAHRYAEYGVPVWFCEPYDEGRVPEWNRLRETYWHGLALETYGSTPHTDYIETRFVEGAVPAQGYLAMSRLPTAEDGLRHAQEWGNEHMKEARARRPQAGPRPPVPAAFSSPAPLYDEPHLIDDDAMVCGSPMQAPSPADDAVLGTVSAEATPLGQLTIASTAVSPARRVAAEASPWNKDTATEPAQGLVAPTTTEAVTASAPVSALAVESAMELETVVSSHETEDGATGRELQGWSSDEEGLNDSESSETHIDHSGVHESDVDDTPSVYGPHRASQGAAAGTLVMEEGSMDAVLGKSSKRKAEDKPETERGGPFKKKRKRKKHRNTLTADTLKTMPDGAEYNRDAVTLAHHPEPTRSLPTWFPEEFQGAARCQSLIDKSNERQIRLTAAADPVPQRQKREKPIRKMPMLDYMANAWAEKNDSMKTKMRNITRGLYNWSLIRSNYLAKVSTSTIGEDDGFDKETWRTIYKGFVGDAVAADVLRKLGLDRICQSEHDSLAVAEFGACSIDTTEHSPATFRETLDLLEEKHTFDGHPLPPKPKDWDSPWLPEPWQAYMVWELSELQFRFELLSLATQMRRWYPNKADLQEKTDLEYFNSITACWGEVEGIRPEGENWLCSDMPCRRINGLRVFAELMRPWPRSAEMLAPWAKHWDEDQIMPGPAEFPDLERSAWTCYQQTYFDHLGHTAPLPHLRPKRPF